VTAHGASSDGIVLAWRGPLDDEELNVVSGGDCHAFLLDACGFEPTPAGLIRLS
jgi:hypothetical protein